MKLPVPANGAGLGPFCQFTGDLESVLPAAFEQYGHCKQDWSRAEFDYTPEAIPVQETGVLQRAWSGCQGVSKPYCKPRRASKPDKQLILWATAHPSPLLTSIRERILRTLENANCFSKKKENTKPWIKTQTYVPFSRECWAPTTI